MTNITPGLLMIVAAAFVPYLPHHIRQVFMLIAIGSVSYTHLTLPTIYSE